MWCRSSIRPRVCAYVSECVLAVRLGLCGALYARVTRAMRADMRRGVANR